MAKIMLVEDVCGSPFKSPLHISLIADGHTVILVGAEGDHLMTPPTVCDVAIIDVGTARGHGCSIARQLRTLDARRGILLLADPQEPIVRRIHGLESGADFCEPKPANLKLLNAYIEVLMRRVKPDAWSIDVKARILRAPEHDAVSINTRELALLKLLASSKRHAADRCAIAEAFGEEWAGFDERVLEKTVSRLRRKWRDRAMCDLPLRTLHGVGYCFTEKLQVC